MIEGIGDDEKDGRVRKRVAFQSIGTDEYPGWSLPVLLKCSKYELFQNHQSFVTSWSLRIVSPCTLNPSSNL